MNWPIVACSKQPHRPDTVWVACNRPFLVNLNCELGESKSPLAKDMCFRSSSSLGPGIVSVIWQRPLFDRARHPVRALPLSRGQKNDILRSRRAWDTVKE